MNLGKLFSAAIFASHRRIFGGVPLARLSNTARRQLTSHRGWGSRSTSHHSPNGAKECARRLAFKARHGYFA
jgi:hypothetical protein